MSVIDKLKKSLAARVSAVNEFQRDLDALRVRILDLKFEIEDLDDAPPSTEEVAARVTKFCDAIVASASNKLAFSALAGSAADHEVTGRMDTRLNSQFGVAQLYGLTGLETWALSSESGFRKRAMDEAQAAAAKAGTRISVADKNKRRTKLQADLDIAERDEEQLVRLAATAGMEITRRHDASPRWVLAPDTEFSL